MKFEIKSTTPEIPEANEMADAAARGIANLLYDHFLDRNTSRPERKGWPKSDYYADAAQSVCNEPAQGGQASVIIAKEGIALHYYGGVVKPKRAKRLAIPMRPEVAGVWPSEYAGINKALFKIKKRNGKAILAVKEGKKVKALWQLVASVTIKKDSSVLPSKAELLKKAADSIRLLFP